MHTETLLTVVPLQVRLQWDPAMLVQVMLVVLLVVALLRETHSGSVDLEG